MTKVTATLPRRRPEPRASPSPSLSITPSQDVPGCSTGSPALCSGTMWRSWADAVNLVMAKRKKRRKMKTGFWSTTWVSLTRGQGHMLLVVTEYYFYSSSGTKILEITRSNEDRVDWGGAFLLGGGNFTDMSNTKKEIVPVKADMTPLMSIEADEHQAVLEQVKQGARGDKNNLWRSGRWTCTGTNGQTALVVSYLCVCLFIVLMSELGVNFSLKVVSISNMTMILFIYDQTQVTTCGTCFSRWNRMSEEVYGAANRPLDSG